MGTSTMIMTLVALTGAVSHVSMGAEIFPIPMLLTVFSCVLGAFGAAGFLFLMRPLFNIYQKYFHLVWAYRGKV